jgi:hypothetical protein
MGYYKQYGRYRSWRGRAYAGTGNPSKYNILFSNFGPALEEIRKAFFALDEVSLNSLLKQYGATHGAPAEKHARKTFPSWKAMTTKLSGQTLERLIELVPPFLTSAQRLDLVKLIVDHHEHKSSKVYRNIRINTNEPGSSFAEIEAALRDMETQDILAHIPERVMEIATWLYNDDATAARAVLANAKHAQNEIMKQSARREINVLKRTITTGQVRSATYSVELPAGTLSVQAYTPKKGLMHLIFGWLK